jgi:rhodanese-related sulfurtransferase
MKKRMKNNAASQGYLEINPKQAKKILFKKSVFLLDVRQPDEFEASHIEGFHLIPLHELKSRIDELGPHKGKEILVMCHHGPRSLYAAQLLKTLGFNAKSISGGLALWSETIDSPVPKYAKSPFGVIRA